MSTKFLGSTSGLTIAAHGTAFIASDYNTGFMPGTPVGAWLSSTDTASLVGGVDTDPDRTGNGNHLIPVGTIDRTPVADGAELVGYSGFSATDYLEAPYNADLDFGTGDFYVMGWATGANTFDALVTYGDPASSGGLKISTEATRDGLRLIVGTASHTHPSGFLLPHTEWCHFAVVRLSGTVYVYSNGVPLRTFSAASSVDGSGANKLRVGGSNLPFPGGSGADPFSGSLALLRIGSGAPSAAHVAAIYAAEAPLFQPGANATLHGASNAVTAIAYDKATPNEGSNPPLWEPHNLVTDSENFWDWDAYGGATRTARSVTYTEDPNSRVVRNISNQRGSTSVTVKAWFTDEDVGKAIQFAVWSDTLNASRSPALTIPEGGEVSYTFTSVGIDIIGIYSHGAVAQTVTLREGKGVSAYRSDFGGMVANPETGDSYVPTTGSPVPASLRTGIPSGLTHVGTSAGRSVFDGLRRVNHTTTSVSTAISAVSGLIAEK